ncbi:hypothetical protein ES708_16873 [subsurface metagenome]
MEDKSRATDTQESDFFLLIGEDIRICLTSWVKEDSQFWRRSVIRTLFSSIEAVVNNLTQRAESRHADGGCTLTPPELMVIREERYELKSNGTIQSRTAGYPFLNRLRFAFRISSKAFGLDFTPNYDDNGWARLQEALKVRDRITHPKNVSGLVVDIEECRAMNRGMLWFQDNVIRLYLEIARVLNERQETLQTQLDEVNKELAQLKEESAESG